MTWDGLRSGEVTNNQLAAAIQLLHRSLERSVVYTQSMYSQFSETMAQMAQQVAELHDASEAATDPNTAVATAATSAVAVAPGLVAVDRGLIPDFPWYAFAVKMQRFTLVQVSERSPHCVLKVELEEFILKYLPILTDTWISAIGRHWAPQ